MSTVRIVTRGDDAGSGVDANRAVAECLAAGILKNASLMACGPAIEDAADRIRPIPDVDLGLHVCLNSEWSTLRWGPVAGADRVPSLVESDGTFTRTPHLLNERGYSLDEAILEVEAQWQRLQDLRLQVRYMDEHMGVGWIPGLRERLQVFAQLRGLNYLPNLQPLPDPPKGLPSDEQFIERVRLASPGNYLYVNHPAYATTATWDLIHEGLDPGQVARERDEDRRLWMDARVKWMASSGEFQPIRYSEIGAA
ncbi:MAG: ChbG/HpnK family deacetylase [Fimbriimonadaceae bacterium]